MRAVAIDFITYLHFAIFYQELCREWNGKKPDEKNFDPFYKAVSAVANSSGTKLKTKIQVLNKVS